MHHSTINSSTRRCCITALAMPTPLPPSPTCIHRWTRLLGLHTRHRRFSRSCTTMPSLRPTMTTNNQRTFLTLLRCARRSSRLLTPREPAATAQWPRPLSLLLLQAMETRPPATTWALGPETLLPHRASRRQAPSRPSTLPHLQPPMDSRQRRRHSHPLQVRQHPRPRALQ